MSEPPSKFAIMRANRLRHITRTSDIEAIRQTPITDLGLTVRGENCMKGELIKTVGDLYDYGNLLFIPNMGKAQVAEVVSALAERGWPPPNSHKPGARRAPGQSS